MTTIDLRALRAGWLLPMASFAVASCGAEAGSPAPARATQAAVLAAPDIGTALGNCGGTQWNGPTLPPVPAGGSPRGELHKHTINVAAYPDAVCNDGSPGVMYIKSAATAAASNRWIILLQGGGGCQSYESCEERWCGTIRGPNYGLNRMTSANTPLQTVAPAVLTQAVPNQFRDWNQVYVYYCTSDGWTGRGLATYTSAATGAQYTMPVQGHSIVDAALSTLEAGARSDDMQQRLPLLTGAEEIVVAGTSAGSGGAQQHLDWVAARYPAALVRGLFDAGIQPRQSTLPAAIGAMLQTDQINRWNARLANESVAPFRDTSCEAALAGTGNEWRCMSDELLHAWVTTPFFANADLYDPVAGERFAIDYGMGWPAYAASVEATLNQLAVVPGASIFGSSCAQHVHLTDVPRYWLALTVPDAGGVPRTLHDSVRRWRSGLHTELMENVAPLAAGCP